jgi:hypothetical protein
LRRHHFTPEEKTWICNYLIESCDDLDNELVAEIRAFGVRYEIPLRAIVQWLEAVSNAEEFDAAALPLDQIGLRLFQECIDKGRDLVESEAQYEERLRYLFAAEVQNTIARRT